MSFNKMTKEELELLSYTDITNIILEEQGELTTPELFRQIVDRLELGKKAFENKIGNYYTSLTTDKRFILLENAKWDLKKKYPTSPLIVAEDLEDIEDLDIEDVYDDEEEETEKDDFADENDEEVEDVAEEYKNLVIIDEEDLNSD